MNARPPGAAALTLFPHDAPPPDRSLAARPPIDKDGRVYTKPWVVDLILDLAGYRPEADLAGSLAVEPAAGHGVFLAAMARRLVRSCRRFGRPLEDALPALIAFEIDAPSAAHTRLSVAAALTEEGVACGQAERLAAAWVRGGDYLAGSGALPPVDFALGNPPYVRLEHMEAGGAAHRGAFATMTGRADLYVAFFEAALRGLRPGGVCAFICADRWMLNQYGTGLRRLVTAGYGVEALVEMHEADPFLEGVSAYPTVSVIRRGPQGPAAVARAGRAAEAAGGAALARSLKAVQAGVPGAGTGKAAQGPPGLTATRVEGWFGGGDPWPCASPERLALLKRLERDFPPLEDPRTATRVGIGVATGADAVFITRDPALIEPSRLLPLALAGDISAGGLAWSGHYLVNPWDGDGLVSLTRFPGLASHLRQLMAPTPMRCVPTTC